MSSLEITLKDKTILVTGAGNGIGLALTKKLWSQGANIYALDVKEEPLSKLVDECPGIIPLLVDLQDWKGTRIAVESIPVPLDGLVNNAGIGGDPSTFMTTTEKSFDQVIGVNLKAIVNVSQVVAQKMIDSGKGGSIVNLSSLASRFGTRASIPYNLSKAGLDLITKTQALEWGPHNIRVNTINPNIVMTDLARQWMEADPAGEALKDRLMGRTPLKRMAEVGEVVNSIIFLLSDAAPMIHGEHLFIDGGYSAF